ncbi:MAG TPA: GNAT family N-acetyltransferase [Acidimicrobiia bacterium]|nr:GNAT family N-acetyltransferase [Acidimicrobiia bacterium]
MADYPAQWESDVVLADGGTARIRPCRPDDEPALLALYERLSDDSIYLRFFSPVPRPTAVQLERITSVDYVDHMVLVAQIGSEIVAIARYDRIEPNEAEVAFAVADDQQRRGLATLLLEHLAVIARAHGIATFWADTLPGNSKMLNVFADAGWKAESHFDQGTVRVRFAIAPTTTSIGVVEARESHAESASIARLLAPRSIAVIGAGREPGKIGHELFRNLLEYGFGGAVYPVHPSAGSVAGVRAYPSVLEVPDAIDLAVIVVPADGVLAVARQCAEKGVRGLLVISAGFAEAGPAGKTAERELVALARSNGMRVIGPNCLGVVNTANAVRMNATFGPTRPVGGNVAFLSQSGGLGIELMSRAGELGIGISQFVSVGNKADVSGNDLLQYWADDAQTDVILLYLESFGNPGKFVRLARTLARSKPIVAVKSGRTAAGSRAASSHTAALASPDVAVDALFRQAGVIRVDTLDELLSTAMVLAHQPLPAGRRVAIVSNAGGPGILAADACAGAGLEVAELAPETQESLRATLTPGASVRNPIDLIAGATADQFERALRITLSDPTIDAVLAIFVPPLVTRAEDVARAIARAAESERDKPVLACFLGHAGVPDLLRGGEGRRTIPSFAFPESAAHALGRVADLADWRRRPPGTVPELSGIDAARARAIVAAALTVHPEGAWLEQPDAAALLDSFGIATIAFRAVVDREQARAAAREIGFPVALKASAPDLVHKSDVGGVALDLRDDESVTRAFDTMSGALGPAMTGAVVQPMVGAGVEVIVGITHDPSFGPLVLFGLGGVTAELLADRALRLVPVTDEDAHQLVRALRVSPLFFGYRGRPAVDVGALEDLLLRVGRLADEIPEIAEMDLNPVIASAEGVVAIDVKIRVVPASVPAPVGLRRMRS